MSFGGRFRQNASVPPEDSLYRNTNAQHQLHIFVSIPKGQQRCLWIWTFSAHFCLKEVQEKQHFYKKGRASKERILQEVYKTILASDLFLQKCNQRGIGRLYQLVVYFQTDNATGQTAWRRNQT